MRPKQTAGCSIIDLTLSMPDLGLLQALTINEHYAIPSDHGLITLDLESLDEMYGNLSLNKKLTGWPFKDLKNEMEMAAKIQREALSKNGAMVTSSISRAELDSEAK